MSTITVVEDGQLADQARTFITLIGVKKDIKPVIRVTVTEDEKPTGEPQKTPVFVLNSSDFISLQLYLQAGLQLPSTAALFESRYPKDAFDKYMKIDTTLYDGLKEQLVMTHGHCERFQGAVVGPMITTGGLVANFGNDADRLVTDILKGIDTITDPKVTSKDPAFDDAKTEIRSACRKVTHRADNLGKDCDKLVKELTSFRTQTESDKGTLEKLNERMTEAMPTKEEQDQEMRSLLKQAEDLYLATHAEIEKTHNEAIEAGEDHLYYYIPIVGTCILIYNLYKQGKLMEKIQDIKKTYLEVREKGKEDLAKVTQAFCTINHLTGDVDRILSTIDGAIKSVEKMSVAFSDISTAFSSIRDNITDVEGDIDETSLKERLVAKKDLERAGKLWAEVSVLAKVFQMHGGLLSFDKENTRNVETVGTAHDGGNAA